MIRIRIDAASALAVLAALNVGNLRGRLQQAVRNTMRDGRTEAKSKIEQRYTAKSPLSLGKVSMRTSGLHGRLTFSGKRNALKRFILRPSTRTPERPAGGIFVSVVKGQGAYLRKAFFGKGILFERLGRSRLPIKHIDTLALSGMAKAVSSSVISRMERRLKTEIDNALGGL